MAEESLPQSDRLSDYEKIMLLCHEIQIKAFGLSQIAIGLTDKIIRISQSEEVSDFFIQQQKWNKEAMAELFEALNKARENIVTYMNECDAVSQFDIDYSNVVYHYVNDLEIPKEAPELPKTSDN